MVGGRLTAFQRSPMLSAMSSPTMQARFASPPHVEFRAVDGGGLLVDVNSGACYRLNGVGAALWSLLASGQPLAGAIESLCTRYDARPEEISSDARSLCSQMITAGLLVEAAQAT